MRKHPFLEVTYRKGRPFAGYLYLSETHGQERCRTEEVRPSVLVDFAEDGEPVGVEFLAPGSVSAEDLHAIEARLHGARLERQDLLPILAT